MRAHEWILDIGPLLKTDFLFEIDYKKYLTQFTSVLSYESSNFVKNPAHDAYELDAYQTYIFGETSEVLVDFKVNNTALATALDKMHIFPSSKKRANVIVTSDVKKLGTTIRLLEVHDSALWKKSTLIAPFIDDLLHFLKCNPKIKLLKIPSIYQDDGVKAGVKVAPNGVLSPQMIISIEDYLKQSRGRIMDVKMYEKINALLTSGDADSSTLAVELMSRFNLIDSFLYIGPLLAKGSPFMFKDPVLQYLMNKSNNEKEILDYYKKSNCLEEISPKEMEQFIDIYEAPARDTRFIYKLKFKK